MPMCLKIPKWEVKLLSENINESINMHPRNNFIRYKEAHIYKTFFH